MESKKCDNPVMFRYTWPGDSEKFACFVHAVQAVQIAAKMGFYLQIHRLDIDEISENNQCSHAEQEFVEGGKPEP